MARKSKKLEKVIFKTKVTRAQVAEVNEGALFCDGYDDCLIGVMRRFGTEPVALYDMTRIIEKMVKRDGMSYDEAVEFFEVNTIGAYVGDNTPAFAFIPD